MSISKDLNEAFKKSQEINHEKSDLLDFSILVLGTASWPLQPPTSGFNIPDDASPQNLSKAEIKTNYIKAAKTAYTLQVNNYQLGILLQYNNQISYTYEELQVSTNLTSEALNGQLGILVKAKILTASGTVGAPNVKYDLNMDFKSKKIRVNLNVAVKSEQKAEAEETHKTIEEDRKLLIQAAIVRVMKTRKQLKHVGLVQEVITQLQSRFQPKIPDIRKCIDILLDREYIERVDGQRDTYNYLA
ncbi:hypothetical protein HK096_007569 [Nowakowskiella sp. JEL0078]|nr:hypothetical protein HK096_007569 [Nowakowskiella sp. JEL0078]